jgi:hypothetical protein
MNRCNDWVDFYEVCDAITEEFQKQSCPLAEQERADKIDHETDLDENDQSEVAAEGQVASQ